MTLTSTAPAPIARSAGVFSAASAAKFQALATRCQSSLAVGGNGRMTSLTIYKPCCGTL